MNEEIDDTEFYHEDFTTASDWEVLVARIEEVLHQWRSITPNETWTVRREDLVYADSSFTIILMRKQVESVICDFSEHSSATLEHSRLADWFGLNEFVVLTSSSVANKESKTKIWQIRTLWVDFAGRFVQDWPLNV